MFKWLCVFFIASALPLAGAVSIASLVRSSDFGRGIAPDDYGTIYGTGMADSAYAPNTSSWPVSLGGVQLFACPATMGVNTVPSSACTSLSLLFVSPAQVNFYIPSKVGGNVLVGSFGGDIVLVASDFTSGLLLTHGVPYAAAIFLEGFDCFIDPRYSKMGQQTCGLTWNQPMPSVSLWCERGAVTDAGGDLLTSSNPAHLGQYVSVWATGLGSFGTTKTMEAAIADPVNGSGSYTFPVAYAGESASSPGLFQINIQIPPALQCGDAQSGLTPLPAGDYSWDLSLTLVGYNGSFGIPNSNAIRIPVVVHPGDVQCSH